MAVKMKPGPGQENTANKTAFEQLHKDNEVKLLPDEKVDGKEVYVLEAVPKKPATGVSEQSSKFYYNKDTGIMVKSVSVTKSEQSKSLVTTQFTDIKPGVDIKPERFVFKDARRGRGHGHDQEPDSGIKARGGQAGGGETRRGAEGGEED